MDPISGLIQGLGVATQPTNLLFCLIGVVLGTIIGVLPGISPVVAMSLLLPLTFTLAPTGALIMMAGIFYGAMYGDASTSILLNIPGEPASVMTAVEGYKLRLKGRAGPTLGLAAMSSFVAGTLSTVALVLFAIPMTHVALAFGPPEYFALVVVAMTTVGALSGGALVKGLVSGTIGLMLATVGPDIVTGVPRFTFGQLDLLGGVPLAVVAVGIFAIGEVLNAIPEMPPSVPGFMSLRQLIPSREDIRFSRLPVLRSTVVGFFVGVLPGTGATIATFLTYAIERRFAKRPELWGHGAIEGVAAVQAADNASTIGTFVPSLTLGIPGSGASAVLLGAFILYGIQPGPHLFTDHPDIAWGLIASMFIGNLMLLILNLPLVSVFIQILRLPFAVLGSATILLSFIGAYALESSFWDVGECVVFGLVGLGMSRFGYPRAPMLLGLVLGGIGELAFRQSMLMSDSGVLIFATRPIAAALLGFAAVFIVWVSIRSVRRAALAR